MNDFMKRIQRLKNKLNIVEPVAVTLVYMDGKTATMDDDAAVVELFTRSDLKEVKCNSEDLRSFLEAMLPGCDCGSDWEDDSGILEDLNEH